MFYPKEIPDRDGEHLGWRLTAGHLKWGTKNVNMWLFFCHFVVIFLAPFLK